MEEIWKDIKGWEGLYQVSNLGRVKSLSRKVKTGFGFRLVKGRILKSEIGKNGYEMIALSDKQYRKLYTVHRLVAKAFIENPNNYPCVNHRDTDKLNNKVENLEWCTYYYNNIYNNRIQKAIETRSKNNHIISDETRQKLIISHLGKKQPIETIRKRAMSLKGRITINNGIVCKRVHPEELENYIQQGYNLGRL